MAIDKNAVIKEAQKFAAKGQFDKAVLEWRKLLKDFPSDSSIFNTIGDLSLKKGDAKGKTEAVEAYHRAGTILAAEGFTSKAIAIYKKVLNIDPHKIEVHLALADLNADKGLTGNALESYKVVADHYLKHKEMQKALGIYQKMADLNPANTAFRLKLADMYAKENMKAEASKAYLEAADVHVSKNALQEARQIFEKVLSLDPDNKAVYHKAGVVYIKEGKFNEACKALKPAFESDPANRELADVYLDALGKAGKDADAEQVIRKVLAVDAGRTDLQEKLLQVYLAKQDYAKALDTASAVADGKVHQGDHDGAEAVLKGLVSASPQYAPAQYKLAELQVAAGRKQDAAGTFIRVAEILTEKDDREGAKAVLARALEIVPDLKEARELLDRLSATIIVTPPPQQPPATAETPTAVRPSVPAQPSAAEEDPAVAEALAEIDVLIKYGLAAKSLEQLEGLARKHPDSAQVHTRLQNLYRDQGNKRGAVNEALLLADLYTNRGLTDQANAALQSAREIEPNNPELLSRLGLTPAQAETTRPSAAGPIELEPAEEMLIPEGEPFLAEPELPELSTPELTPLAEEAPTTPEEAAPPAPADDLSFAGLEAELELPEEAIPAPEEPVVPMAEEPSLAEPLAGVEPVIPEPELQPTAAEPVSGPETPVEPAQAEASPVPAPAEEADIEEIRAEADFYYQQGLFAEAKKHFAKIIQLDPSDRRALDKLADISRDEEETSAFEKLAEAVEDLEGAVPPEAAQGELSTSESDEEAVRSLMQEISELKKPPEPVPLEQDLVASAVEPPKIRAEEDFFDLGEELAAEGSAPAAQPEGEKRPDDFFDLAAELRDELSSVAAPSHAAPAAQEQSLDEIFEEFKKGVEQQSIKEDVDTHYNLGIAYKEMGLLDDAIAEFIMTPDGEPKFVQSRYMLGLCYMEQGEYQNAILEIGNALSYSENLGEDERSRIDMHYDLGLAYQGAGNMQDAISEFQRVAQIDTGHRDVAAKLKELQQGEFISLEQLKEDIEKEISARFFEEGERIEREEKNRKNEHVGNL